MIVDESRCLLCVGVSRKQKTLDEDLISRVPALEAFWFQFDPHVHIANCQQTQCQLQPHQAAGSMAAGPPPTAPYSVHLDPESARRLATNGATILLLDVPEATPIGLDQQVLSGRAGRQQ